MFDRFTLGFATVFLLTAYLYYRINRRAVIERPKLDFQPTPIDVSKISPTIQRVRSNPLSERVTRPHQNKKRSRLIANARALVENLAFFRRSEDAR